MNAPMRKGTHTPLRPLRISLIALFLTVIYGTVGYIVIAGFTFLDALFMTVSTVTTEGFGDVKRLGTPGKIFTMTLILFGVINFLYTFGVFVELISSGRLLAYRRERRLAADLRARRDHIVVCGYGRTGKKVVEELRLAGESYVVVEMNPAPLADVIRDGQLHVVGDAASDDVLQQAGILRAKALVSVVDSDERNVYIVLTARNINPDLFIVARSAHPESAPKLRRAGADRVVSPYTTGGRRMAALAVQPAVVDVIDTMMTGAPDGMNLEELRIPPDAEEITVGALRKTGAVLLALRGDDGQVRIHPTDTDVLASGSIVVAMGTRDQLRQLSSAVTQRSAAR